MLVPGTRQNGARSRSLGASDCLRLSAQAALSTASSSVLNSFAGAATPQARPQAARLSQASLSPRPPQPQAARQGVASPSPRPPQPPPSFETWRLDLDYGPTGAVRVSEFADSRPVSNSDHAYRRPTNKRDLGHLCNWCRRPFNCLGMEIVAELHGGPSVRYHSGCWRRCISGKNAHSEPHTRAPTPVVVEDAGAQPEAVSVTRSEPLAPANVVAAYADEWRRSQSCRNSSRRPPAGPRSRSRVDTNLGMQDLVSVEGSSGQRMISVGFSLQDIEGIKGRWSCASEEAGECAICFSNCRAPLRLPCKHNFCASCVEPWLRKCSLCPMCRGDLRRPPGRPGPPEVPTPTPTVVRLGTGLPRPGPPQRSRRRCRT